MIQIGKNTNISEKAHIEDSIIGSNIIIEDGCFIDSFVRIRPVGGTGDVVIGPDCYINSGTVIFSGNGVKLGRLVLIAPNCTIVATNHSFEKKDVTIRHQGFKKSKGGIVIENDVWIGANSTILDGAYIPDGVVLAANTIVGPRDKLEAYSVYAGNPLRKISERK